MLQKALLKTIRFYQGFISVLSRPHCRFEPTCSHYSILAIEKYGIVKGAALSVWRILRCNPFCKGGVDNP